ncbi:BQ5605_C007g04448 [Microbotryum silenes-dioicae]|uniref:BQ5605_C007g04448 protein n=1 Tax=Microbotryum silenes-dioicae TaxID=796604 RepID=A0A2X0P2Q4_9BASI|nr:BQ5605_C007g04448 [Microbotryum silenes-dioicae]
MKRHSGIRTAGQDNLSDHTMEVACSDVVDDRKPQLCKPSSREWRPQSTTYRTWTDERSRRRERTQDAVQEMGFNSGKARKKKKKTKTTKDEKQIEDGKP